MKPLKANRSRWKFHSGSAERNTKKKIVGRRHRKLSASKVNPQNVKMQS